MRRTTNDKSGTITKITAYKSVCERDVPWKRLANDARTSASVEGERIVPEVSVTPTDDDRGTTDAEDAGVDERERIVGR